MCGSENRLFKAEIESTVLNVCEYCARFGKVVAKVSDKRLLEKLEKKKADAKQEKASLISKDEMFECLSEDFHEIIRRKRDQLGLKQEDFAKKINEKVSLVHNIETGNFEPNLELARKIERFLGVKIIEERINDADNIQKPSTDSFTLGDFIKVRKRQ